jgi:hypothetical protein
MEEKKDFNEFIKDFPVNISQVSIPEYLESLVTPTHRDAFKIVYWYHYGRRCTGRTYVSAVAAVCCAFEHPHLWVQLHDHNGFDRDRYQAMKQAVEVLKKFPPEIRDCFEFDKTSYRVRYIPKADVEEEKE